MSHESLPCLALIVGISNDQINWQYVMASLRGRASGKRAGPGRALETAVNRWASRPLLYYRIRHNFCPIR
jgi:hypothetical protein